MNQEKKKELKSYQRTRLKFTLPLILLCVIAIILFCVLLHLFIFNFINKGSYIDDRYGNLDTNTRMVLEKKLDSIMKEKKVTLQFSYITGDDVNEYYFQEVAHSQNTLLIYYNENTNQIKLKTEHPDFCDYDMVLESSTTELCDNLTSYINTLNTKIEKNRFLIYFASPTLYTQVIAIILILELILAIVIGIYINKHKSAFHSAKSNIKRLKQEVKQTKHHENATIAKNENS